MTADEMWNAFVKTNRPEEKEYEAWAFGGAPDELAALVLQGEKTAASSAYELYGQGKEPLPKAGGYSVILNIKRGGRVRYPHDEGVCRSVWHGHGIACV